MATWKAFRVADIVNDIDEERYVLPVIQRELVWTEDKMTLLFDSLLKGNSFGSVIVIEEEKDSKPLFASRIFSKDGNKKVSQNKNTLSQTQYFVIDGQQRLQSFYIGLKGSFNDKILFFDLYSDYNSEYEFEFAKEENDLPSKTKEERPIKECFWVSAKDLLRKLKDSGDDDDVSAKFAKEKELSSDDEKKKYLEKNVKAFLKNVINAESVGVARVSINRTLSEVENKQKIVELFRRLNDGGTKLSAMDLVASTLKGYDYKMEGFLRSMQQDYADIGLSPENLIKLVFLLRDNNTKEMAAIDTSDAEFAVSKIERIKSTMKAVRIFLEYSRTYEFFKDSNRSFIPLFFIAYHLFHKDLNNKQIESYWDDWETTNDDFKPMKIWLYHSLLNGVFKSRGAGWIPYKTGIKKILECIKECKNKAFPLQPLLNVYKNHPLNNYTEIYNSETLDQLDRQFVFYVMYDCTKATRTNDIDHIMPKNILFAKGFEANKVNSIKNYQLLDYNTNRGDKNGKPFAQWINDSNSVGDKDNYIRYHLIPSNETIWTEDKFLDFSEERAKLILKKINDCFV